MGFVGPSHIERGGTTLLFWLLVQHRGSGDFLTLWGEKAPVRTSLNPLALEKAPHTPKMINMPSRSCSCLILAQTAAFTLIVQQRYVDTLQVMPITIPAPPAQLQQAGLGTTPPKKQISLGDALLDEHQAPFRYCRGLVGEEWPALALCAVPAKAMPIGGTLSGLEARTECNLP
jgi:hypothetical protein